MRCKTYRELQIVEQAFALAKSEGGVSPGTARKVEALLSRKRLIVPDEVFVAPDPAWLLVQ
jgi:hypothetical protein